MTGYAFSKNLKNMANWNKGVNFLFVIYFLHSKNLSILDYNPSSNFQDDNFMLKYVITCISNTKIQHSVRSVS